MRTTQNGPFFMSAPTASAAATHPDRPVHAVGVTSPMANAIRALAMDAVQQANSGHPGLPMGAADIATVLFTQFLKFDPAAPHWADRDRFVLSAGHGSMLMCPALSHRLFVGVDRRHQALPPARLEDTGTS
jgi:transketolase